MQGVYGWAIEFFGFYEKSESGRKLVVNDMKWELLVDDTP
jgi:hypothetical protein